MLLGFVLLFAYGFIVWLVFFKFRWLKFTIPWGFFSTFFVLHLGIIFLIGLRFVAPTSTEARVIQRTIQLTPRLSEPTLVTAVLVEPNVHVKRGTPLFQFDRRIYEAKVKQLAGATRPGEAERADHESRHPGGERENREAQERARVRPVPAEAVHRSGQDGFRPGRGRPEVERSGRGRQRGDQGSAGRGAALAAQVPIRDRRREHRRWQRPRPSSTRRFSTSTTR